MRAAAEPIFEPYGFTGEIPDPVARALNGLLDEVSRLRARVAELERERDGAATRGRRAPERRSRPVRRRVGAQP